MDIEIYKFPHLVAEERTVVEQTYCDLLVKYRDGIVLAPEVVDWMDSANNWLQSTN